MCNKTTPDAAAAALTTLMHALIDIECTAELAQGEEQKDRTQFALECIRYIATRSLNDAKNILDIAANYADFVTEAVLRKTTDGD
ncbi:hypothetical protein ACH2O5_RS28595 [Escherichia coli]